MGFYKSGRRTKPLHAEPGYSASATLATSSYRKVYVSNLPSTHAVDFGFNLPSDYRSIDEFVVWMTSDRIQTFNMTFGTVVRTPSGGSTTTNATDQSTSFTASWGEVDLTSLTTDITAAFTAGDWVGLRVQYIAAQGAGQMQVGGARISYY